MPAPVEPNAEFAGNLRFELVRRIGAGGIGLVYEATDRSYGTRVAVKTLQRLDGEALLRFKNEFRMLQGIHHPNLVRLGELFEEGGHWFFTMELLDGVDFMTYVADRDRDSGALREVTGSGKQNDTVPYGKQSTVRYPAMQSDDGSLVRPLEPSTVALSPQTLQRMAAVQGELDAPGSGPMLGHVFDEGRLRHALRQLAEGLGALHRAGMVHRDIKPHNVMVCANRVVLLDFGLVSEERPWHRHDNEEGLVLGTPTYMAPEQAAGHAATPASDWYGVGTMLYQALTGRRPFEGQVGQILLEKQVREPVAPSRRVVDPATVPRDLEILCMQLLQRDPALRPSGAEVLAVLSGGVPEELREISASMPVLGADAEIDLIGRARELEALRSAFAACTPGHPMLAFVSGGSGMGKTALIDHFARAVRDRSSALVLRGRCYEREAVPYKAFDGAIDELSRYLHRLRLALDGDPDSLGEGGIDDSDIFTRVNAEPDSTSDSTAGSVDGSVSIRASGSVDGGKRSSNLGLSAELDPRMTETVRGLLASDFSVLARLFPVLEGVFDEPVGFGGQSLDDGRNLPARTGFDRGEVTRETSFAGDIRDPSELRRRAFTALKLLLGRIAEVRPLVVVIDDLQWGDPDSAVLLADLISPPNAPNLLVLASYRSEEARGAFMTALRENVLRAVEPTSILDLDVGPLSESDSRHLAKALWRRLDRGNAAHTSSDADGLTAEYITGIGIRDCAGSPFFIGEMMRYLASAPDDAPQAHGRITLERVLRERRHQLGPGARTLLDVVAVAGRPLPQGLALRAARLDGAAIGALSALRAGHFVRTRGPGLADAVEVYHDRIREAVLADLDAGELRDYHGRLADALIAAGSDDPEMLAEHCLAAGRLERAAEHALRAAENAERALAFDRAARMLRLALDARAWPEPERRDLLIRLGECLGNAGRGAEAVEAYLTAAEVATASSAPSALPVQALVPVLSAQADFDVPLECRRRAADQMFRSGSFDEGRSLLDTLMRSVHLRVPRSSKGALLSLILHRVWLRLRGLRYRPRLPEHIPSRDRQRIDLMWAGALAISAVDLVRGSDLATRSLLMALCQGDEARIAAAMALEAGHVASRGSTRLRRSVALARRASTIARRNGDPGPNGLAALAPGIIALLTGRWRLAQTKLARSEEIFREQCIGATWEAATAQMFRCLALYYLGEWEVLGQQASTSLRHALDRGDRYTAAVLDCLAPYGELRANDIAGARRLIDQAAVHWQATNGYHLQHYLQLLVRIQIDLYAGEATAAWARIASEWSRLRRSLLLRVQMTRIESTHLRARCALAMAALAPAEIDRYVRIAARAGRRLRREPVAWSAALGVLVQAGVAALRDRATQAITLLEEAEDRLEQADMYMFAAAAQWQRGRLVGGNQGRDILRRADAAMARYGVVNPAAVAGMLAPGFPAQSR